MDQTPELVSSGLTIWNPIHCDGLVVQRFLQHHSTSGALMYTRGSDDRVGLLCGGTQDCDPGSILSVLLQLL